MKQLVFSALILVLSGCSLLAPTTTPSNQDAESIRNTAQNWRNWQALGKTSIRVDGDNTTANLDWVQQAKHYEINLTGPLGQGGARITGSENEILIEASGEEPIYSTQPEALLEAYFGWSFPPANVQWWLKGIPSPSSRANSTYDEQGLIQRMTQNGWQIEYLQYHQEAPFLPRKLRLKRPPINALIVINEWQPLSSE